MALVLLLARVVHAEDEAVGLHERRLRAVRHGIELAEVARGDERSVLALVQLRVDPHVLEVLQDELGVVREDRGAVRREADAPGEAARIPGRGQQAPCLRRVVLEVSGALAELSDGQRPLLQRRRHGRIEDAHALLSRVDHALAIDGERNRLTHAEVVEGRPIGAHRYVRLHVAGELRGPELGANPLQRVLDLDPVRAVDRAGELPAQVVLPGEERRHARGVVLVDGELDAIDGRQAGHEVARVPDEREASVGAIALEHPGTGADNGLGLLEIAELLDALAGDDRHGHRIGEGVEEPREWLLQCELHRVTVHRLHAAHRFQHVGARVALDAQEPLDRVPHVLRGQLAAVDRRLGMPAHAPAQLEHVGGLVRLRPRLGEVAFQGKGGGRDARSGLVADQPAVREADRDLDPIRGAEHLVEERRIPRADRERASTLRGLPARRAGAQRAAGERGGRDSEQTTTREAHCARVGSGIPSWSTSRRRAS